jgi:hypothetical protein
VLVFFMPMPAIVREKSRCHAVLALLCTLALAGAVSGCFHQVDTPYVPTVAPAPSPIRTLQVGTFLGEELYELAPRQIAHTGKNTFYRLPVPAEAFLRQAFLAEVGARQIVVAESGRRVSGELLRFEFPCDEAADAVGALRCSMRFRFTIRDHGAPVFEKIYDQSISIGSDRGTPERELVGQAFVRLLGAVFAAFLEDPAVSAVFNSTAPSMVPEQGQASAIEGRGIQRNLKDNRIYLEVFGRGLLGIYYDRKVLKYGYVGIGGSLFPPRKTHGREKCTEESGARRTSAAIRRTSSEAASSGK